MFALIADYTTPICSYIAIVGSKKKRRKSSTKMVCVVARENAVFIIYFTSIAIIKRIIMALAWNGYDMFGETNNNNNYLQLWTTTTTNGCTHTTHKHTNGIWFLTGERIGNFTIFIAIFWCVPVGWFKTRLPNACSFFLWQTVDKIELAVKETETEKKRYESMG